MPTYFRSDGWVKATTGAAIPGAQIYVATQPANVAFAPPTPLATIYSDPDGLVPITQPILTDGFGHYDFYVLPGTYSVVVALGGIIQQVYPDQSIGVSGGGGGTVSSVGLTADPGAILAVSGSPITSSGTLALSFPVQAANKALMGPSSGPAAVPSFRQPAFADLSSNIAVSQMASGTGATSSTFWRGDGSWAAPAGASFTGSNSAWMVGPGLSIHPVLYNNAASGNATMNSTTWVVQFFLPYAFRFDRIVCRVSAATTAGKTFAFGIYDSTGTLLLDSGTYDGANTAIQSNSVTATTLAAGTYYYAWGSNANAGVYGVNAATITGNVEVWNTGFARFSTSANSFNGTNMPATLGSLTAVTAINIPGIPLPVFYKS